MGGLSHTVSGDIASFRTPSRVPIESLKFHFLPKQATGTPSLANPIPIEGWTGLNGERSGKNLLNTSTRAMPDHYELNGITFDYNSDSTLTVNGSVSQDASAGPQYRIAVWEQQVTGNYYICVDAPYTTAYNEVFVYDSTLSERPKKWDGVTASQSAGSNRPLSEVRLIAGHTYSYNIRITRGTEKEYHDDKFYPMLLPSWCTDTTFEPYSGELIPVTFPDGEIIYGGYIDPVAGEIVAEWVSETDNGKQWNIGYGNAWQWGHSRGADPDVTSINYYKKSLCTHSKNLSVSWRDNAYTIGLNQNGALYLGKEFWKLMGYENNVTAQEVQNFFANQALAGTPVYICSPLETPIHVPVPAEDMKAFLDYNNFWSDANDITEVTYAVTESKDILATRKKAMDFDHAHHKKVKWNQIVRDGNFTSKDHWLISANDYGTVSVNDNIAAWTSTNPELQHYYQTGLTNKQFYLNIPENHRVLVKATVRSSVSRTDSNHRVSIFGMINYENSYSYTQNDVQANTWTDLFGFIRDNRTEGKKITRFKVCYGGTVDDGTIPVGTVLEVKNFMAFDLTQMFGLGNEPSTVAEFEHICELNGIDLTTYHPYDTGSDRWLIVP